MEQEIVKNDLPVIGIMTPFGTYDNSYSLVSVVNDQLVANLKHGHTVVLFVLESFNDDVFVPEGVIVRKALPQFYLEKYKGMSVPDDWKKEVKAVKDACVMFMQDIDVLITHDIIFVDSYLPYNIGLREAELPCRQLHFIHSAPSPRPVIDDNPHANRYNLPKNSTLVYLNNEQVIPLAEMYGVWPKDVAVVKNSVDPRTFWGDYQDSLVSHIVEKYDLFSRDIITVYPLSTTRMVDGKQIDVVIRIHKQLRKLGKNPLLIVPNAHANGSQERAECIARANDNVVFTSLLKFGIYEHGVPRSTVSALFRLSNLFIFPSISENCSLVLLEAMLSGNLLVLNEDCPGLQDIVGRERALWFKFGGLRMGTRTHENALEKDTYLTDIARIIASELDRNLMYKAKVHALREYNYDTMYRSLSSLYYAKN